ncbi:SDR family oxidoreductase [Ruminococcus sp.]|uniref:SDR family NAD(P)-dependent oxidoreductase n=1 Tax=Ruminococcus sp. TaxID=41978 RepID=UPI0025DCFA2B|nr:SDR family oxidoreductase [Ruminococcus sp.]MBQ8965281.1 SDR family oxidoreductase [Ruminococcus sp.]
MRICLMCRKRNMEEYGICPECRALNDEMRGVFCDLTGRNALVTGGRIKIGYAVCLRLLRQGANVIAVTRYPRSALEKYMQEPDYEKFRDRLTIIGFDLMRVDRLHELIQQIKVQCGGKLDILVNNAAQTVKRSNEYYRQLIAHESELRLESSKLFPMVQAENSFSIMPSINAVDYGETDNNNSWVRKSEEITPQELLEVQLINVTAPFMLTSGLRVCLAYSSKVNTFVLNVSSVEGRFNTKQKLARHVHTNMAKASLNMMTHSIASDYARDRIFVYSTDPGWVSNQFPPGYEISKDFTPYLSYEDGAVRVLYPMTLHLDDEKIKDSGTFFKDFRIIDF